MEENYKHSSRSSIDDFCWIFNLSLLTYGYGKLNLFELRGKAWRSLTLRWDCRLFCMGFPVNKQEDASSRLCMMWRGKHAQQTLNIQRDLSYANPKEKVPRRFAEKSDSKKGFTEIANSNTVIDKLFSRLKEKLKYQNLSQPVGKTANTSFVAQTPLALLLELALDSVFQIT